VKPEYKRQLECPKHRREGDIKSDHKEVGWQDADSISLVLERGYLRVFNTVI
jgi:hypothetical protein